MVRVIEENRKKIFKALKKVGWLGYIYSKNHPLRIWLK